MCLFLLVHVWVKKNIYQPRPIATPDTKKFSPRPCQAAIPCYGSRRAWRGRKASWDVVQPPFRLGDDSQGKQAKPKNGLDLLTRLPCESFFSLEKRPMPRMVWARTKGAFLLPLVNPSAAASLMYGRGVMAFGGFPCLFLARLPRHGLSTFFPPRRGFFCAHTEHTATQAVNNCFSSISPRWK